MLVWDLAHEFLHLVLALVGQLCDDLFVFGVRVLVNLQRFVEPHKLVSLLLLLILDPVTQVGFAGGRPFRAETALNPGIDSLSFIRYRVLNFANRFLYQLLLALGLLVI